MDIDEIDTKKIILIPILVVVALLAVFFVGSSISIVGPNERGVRVTLGRVDTLCNACPHFKEWIDTLKTRTV